MKAIKNIVRINGLVRLVAALAVVFVGYINSAEKTMNVQRGREQLKKELIAAEWSQKKIKELREKTGSTVQMKYDRVSNKTIYMTQNQPLSHLKEALDDILIDHYAQKIYAALEGIPVSERGAWADELHLILIIGLDDFFNKGKERYEAGKLSTIDLTNDGSEIGVFGTKYKALKRVKSETDNFATIPFNNDVPQLLPVVFFNTLLYGDMISARKL